MIEVTLNEAAYTIIIGIVFLAGTFIPVYLFREDWLTRDCTPSRFVPAGWWIIVALIGLVGFFANTFTESLSDYLSDDLAGYPGETTLRTRALFDAEKGTLTPLGRVLYDQGSLQRHGLHTAVDHGSVANSLYYVAKNTVYRNANYFQELTVVQARIDFLRSLALMSMSLFAIGVLLLLIFLHKSRPVFIHSCATVPVKARRAFLLILAHLAIGLLSLVSFGREEGEFNDRVFGYYSTLVGEASPRPLSRAGLSRIHVPLTGIVKWRDDYMVVTDERRNGFPRLYNLEIRADQRRLYPATVQWGQLDRQKPIHIESICSTTSRTKREDIWVLESTDYSDEAAGYSQRARLVRLKLARARGFQLEYDRDYTLPPDISTPVKSMHCWRGENDTPFFIVAEADNENQTRLLLWRIDGDRIVPEGHRSIPKLNALGQEVTVSCISRSDGGSGACRAQWLSGLAGQFRDEAQSKQWLWAVGNLHEKTPSSSVVYRVAEIVTDGERVQWSTVDNLIPCRVMSRTQSGGIEMTGNLAEFAIVTDEEPYGRTRILTGCQQQ